MRDQTELLRMEGVRKRFGATIALDGVDLFVRAGEVLALVGENGAGKSTLMKTLSGAHSPDEGRMWLSGQPYQPKHPHGARNAGVSMIYQELSLARHLTVMENIVLGMEPTAGPFVKWKEFRKQAQEEVRALCDRFTVLRDGKSVGSGMVADTPNEQIIAMMVGRSVEDLYPRSNRTVGDAVLELKELAGVKKPASASLTLHRGEVLGIAGLVGTGRTELLRAIFGLDPVRSGRLRLKTYVGAASHAKQWARGMGMVSEDRKLEGLALSLSIADNLTLSSLGVQCKCGLGSGAECGLPRRKPRPANAGSNGWRSVAGNLNNRWLIFQGATSRKSPSHDCWSTAPTCCCSTSRPGVSTWDRKLRSIM